MLQYIFSFFYYFFSFKEAFKWNRQCAHRVRYTRNEIIIYTIALGSIAGVIDKSRFISQNHENLIYFLCILIAQSHRKLITRSVWKTIQIFIYKFGFTFTLFSSCNKKRKITQNCPVICFVRLNLVYSWSWENVLIHLVSVLRMNS